MCTRAAVFCKALWASVCCARHVLHHVACFISCHDICRSSRLDNPAIQSISLTPHQSVEAVLKIIANLTTEDTGNFFKYDGTPMPY